MSLNLSKSLSTLLSSSSFPPFSVLLFVIPRRAAPSDLEVGSWTALGSTSTSVALEGVWAFSRAVEAATIFVVLVSSSSSADSPSLLSLRMSSTSTKGMI